MQTQENLKRRKTEKGREENEKERKERREGGRCEEGRKEGNTARLGKILEIFSHIKL